MTNEEAIYVLKNTAWLGSDKDREATEDAVNMAIEALKAQTGWIPVSERLPENSRCVLISIAGDIEFGAYDRQNSDWAIWRDGYWDEGKRADAWMPLPEPYKEVPDPAE